MKSLLCLLICIPGLLLAQTPYKAELSLQLMGLGIGTQYEYAWKKQQSIALLYGVDWQNIGEAPTVIGSQIQLHYRYCFGGQTNTNEIQSGVILSLFAEHAFKRVLDRFNPNLLYQSSGLGLLVGYRLLPGKKERFSFSVLLGAKYVVPHLKIPDWYQSGQASYSVQGFRPHLSVGLGWKIQQNQDHD